MSEISIKVNVAGRSYPLTIGAHEEAVIRQAEQGIESSIQSFQKNYAVKDRQDLLAMAALQVAASNLTKANAPAPVVKATEPPDYSRELQELENLVDSLLV